MEEQQFILSPDLAYRLAAIDIGTNSIRLIIAEPLRDGSYRILDEEKATTRLGRALNSTGRLDPEAVEQSLAALRSMKQIAAGYQVREIRVIGTCAIREATDAPEFCRRALEEVGLEIEVISGEREAHLAFLSVARNFNLAGKNVAVADIGGGSTEIVLASGNVIEAMFTTPLGAVRVSEIYSAGQEMTTEAFNTMIEGIDRKLRRATKKTVSDLDAVLEPHVLIGSGGTFTALADMIMNVRRQVGLPLRGYEVTQAELRHLMDRLRKLGPKARRNIPGLSSDRADIIVAGLAIIDCLMRKFRVNRVQIHDRGVRDGLLLTMIDKSTGTTNDSPQDRDAAITRFALACGVDQNHSDQVARLAGEIFEQVAGSFNLPLEDRVLLETAARLQDVGYLINYDQHHKHSYHLILHCRIPGFQPHELELIANVARYHRGSMPKRKHANFTQLSPADQLRVRRMAAILRMAIGLDRSHSQQVKGVTACLCNGKLDVLVQGEEYPEADIWGARRRCEAFEKVFEVPVSFEWQDPRGMEPDDSAALH